METEFKSINVLIVTYKQADVIGRNLDSILQQKEYGLHEIVICDDCSPDNNWDVIQSYVQKYPKIIRAYRNDHNLGIYGNSDKCASLHGDADLFCWLEGDDELNNGFFKSIQSFIQYQNIDIKQPICIQTDFTTKNNDGSEYKYDNSYLSSHINNPLGAYIRMKTTWRASMFSKSVLCSFQSTILSNGLGLAEMLFDSQWITNIVKSYYIPIVGSFYYSGIGVSTQLQDDSSAWRTTEYVAKWTYFYDNILLNKRDKYYAKSQILLGHLRQRHSLSVFLKYTWYYIAGMIGYGCPIKNIAVVFANTFIKQ